MSQNALYIDYEFCSGCHSCEIACRNELELPIEDFGMKLLEDKPRQHADGSWHWDYIAVPGELWDVRTISDTLYPAAAVDRLYCSGLIQPSDSFGLSSL